MLYSPQRMSTLQYIALIEVYIVMVLFHFNSQPISIYYTKIKKNVRDYPKFPYASCFTRTGRPCWSCVLSHWSVRRRVRVRPSSEKVAAASFSKFFAHKSTASALLKHVPFRASYAYRLRTKGEYSGIC